MANEVPRHFLHQVNETYELPSVVSAQAKRRLPGPMASRIVDALVGAHCPLSKARALVAEDAWLASDPSFGDTLMLWVGGCGRGCRDLESLGSAFDEMLDMLVCDLEELNAELQNVGLEANW